MATKLTIQEVVEQEGCESQEELLEMYGNDSVVPACCSEGCQVEPDGRCEHNFPSILLRLGII